MLGLFGDVRPLMNAHINETLNPEKAPTYVKPHRLIYHACLCNARSIGTRLREKNTKTKQSSNNVTYAWAVAHIPPKVMGAFPPAFPLREKCKNVDLISKKILWVWL
jgi:hypothetical protein